MRRIVLDMQCRLFADAVSQSLSGNDPDFETLRAESSDETVRLCKSSFAYAVIMEVSALASQRVEKRLALSAKVRESSPKTKIVFLVDERADPGLAEEVRQAKKDGLIDNFIYASVSSAYLSAIIDTL